MTKILLLTLLALAPQARAANEGASGGQFLRIGVDARSASLGETGAAASGARAMFYNPAGLAAVAKPELFLSYSKWIGDTGYSGLAFAKKAGGGAFGLAASYLAAPPTDKYDKYGNDLGQTYTASDIAVLLGYARNGDNGLSFGMDVKYIRSALEDETAGAAAADAGLQWRSAGGKAAFGASLLNAGGTLKYASERESLPLTMKFGGSYKLNLQKVQGKAMDLAFFADVNSLTDSGASLHAGADFMSAYDKDYNLALRLGYKTSANGSASGLTAGLGVEAEFYSVDYAYAPMGDLGSAHRFSVTVKFGGWKRRGL